MPGPDLEDLERVAAYAIYRWDCPSCDLDVDEGDIEPSGVVECPDCHERVVIA